MKMGERRRDRYRSGALQGLGALLVMACAAVAAPAICTAQITFIYAVDSDGTSPDADPGDGECQTATGECTLRAAVQEANLDSGASLIIFAAPYVIVNSEALELTEDYTTIDAGGVWDTSLDRPGVQVGGGMTIKGNWCTLRGLLFASEGLTIHGSNNTIGGSDPGQRNVFLADIGITINFGELNIIESNYFNTQDGVTKTAGTHTYGISLQSQLNEVRGNLIVGCAGAGIYSWSSYNTLHKNTVGADYYRLGALANAFGIYLENGQYNVVENNFICGNLNDGLHIDNASSGNTISNNQIGTTGLANGGDGIYVGSSANDNQILNNTISGNSGHGIHITGVTGSLVLSNNVGYNSGDGILVENATGVALGGSATGQGNAVSLNGGNGIHLRGSGTWNNIIRQNYIGGAYWEAGNQGHGILLENGAHGNIIGGDGILDGNWINWNLQDGIRLSGSGTSSNTLLGNVLGVSMHWAWAAPNGHHGIGIYDGADNNLVGVLEKGNTILASSWSGVAIVNSDGNTLVANRIGTDGTSVAWGNRYYGVNIVDGSDNQLTFNKIAYNGSYGGQAGVRIDGPGALRNDLAANSIHGNGGKGIELVNGANGNTVPPILMEADRRQVLGTACSGCIVELFSDIGDEGEKYEGHTTADAGGAFSFTGNIRGPNVTATARSAGNASGFSAPFDVSFPWLLYLPSILHNRALPAPPLD